MPQKLLSLLALVVACAVLGAPASAGAKAPGLQKRTLDGPRPSTAFAERAPVAAQQAARPAKRAAKGGKARGRRKADLRQATFVLRGTIVEVDAAARTVLVDVEGGNRRGRRFTGEEVRVDVRRAALTDGQEKVAFEDLTEGDEVIVQARLPRSAYAGDVDVVKARRLTLLVDDEVDETDEDVAAAEPAEPPVEPVEPDDDAL
jgi:hypothetical protein